MNIILKPEVYSIKNGVAAHSPEIGLTTHGHSEEIAKLNLEKTAVMFLKPFEREGQLKDAIKRMKLTTTQEEQLGIIVTVI